MIFPSSNNDPSPAGSPPSDIRTQAGFLLGSAAVFLITFTLLRALLLYRNFDLTADIPASEIARAFGVGVRFDLVIVCYCMLPLVFTLLIRSGPAWRRVSLVWLGFCGAIGIFLGIAELDFYREFHARLNSIAFQYLKEDPKTVLSMLWFGFPVVRYLLLCSVLWGLYLGGLLLVDKGFPASTQNRQARYRPFVRLLVFLLVLSGGVAGARGTLRAGPPLRWGDAYISPHMFTNHLGLNGTFTLAKALEDVENKNKGRKWLKVLPRAEATAVTRNMLVTNRDELLETDRFAVLRRHRPLSKPGLNRIKNIVVIVMESFSAEFVGALREYGVTPEFDRLAGEGLLFDHFFSNGTHTHQGMFASLASFPNLPGHEYLMQQPQGGNSFSGLPSLLKERGFNDIYVYNGDFAWDNQEGFFRNQGMTRFVGRKDYRNPKFVNPTWGVSDEDMFERAVIELESLAQQERPFFAVLQTLSNHTPYVLPDPLPFDPVKADSGFLAEHLTAMKYSDWALGRFFKAAKQSSYYRDTLFVITGDHGFVVPQQLAGIDILMYHVPLLLIGPGIREAYGSLSSVVGTQVDLVPTIVGLLGKPFVHQSWGRDLLALPEDDPGFGIIKPSGGNQTTSLIEGNYVLTRTPDEQFVLSTYKLYPQPQAQTVVDPVKTREMTKKLQSYIQTALISLYENRTGRP